MNQKLSELQKITNRGIRKEKIQKITLTIKKVSFCIMLVIFGASIAINYYEGKKFICDYLHAVENATRIIEYRNAGPRSPVTVNDEDGMEVQPASVEETTSETPLQGSIEEQIREVAKQEGFTDADLLKKIAFCESTYRPDATNAYSTATGLFQFTKGTWEEGCKATGNDWTLKDRTDVEKATRMAIYFIAKGQISRWSESQHCWAI